LLHSSRSSGRIVVRSDRPSSIVAPNRNITKVEIGDVGQQPQRRSASGFDRVVPLPTR
jgi:hypothetical protein